MNTRYQVKELGIGGILDQSIRVFRDHFKFVIGIAFVVFVPGVVMAIVQASLTTRFQSFTPGDTPQPVAMGTLGAMYIIMMASVLVLSITNAICTAAAALGVTHRYLGNNLSAGECLRAALRRWAAILWASLLYAICVGIGFVLLVIPGYYLMLSWYVLYPVIMFEDVPVMDSFGRSRALMYGHKGKAFVVLFVLGILWMAVGVFAQLVPNVYAAAVISQFVSMIGIAFNSVVVTVVYVSARCHTEQFDLEMLTQMVEGKQQAQEAAL